ncbi:MAG: hypothetical protein U0163_00115 [Gemmatimonadaceae bacterium]
MWAAMLVRVMMVTATPVLGAPQEVKVASTGNTVVATTTGGALVQATIRAREVDIGPYGTPRPAKSESNCTYSQYPCTLVDRIDIAIGGHPVLVPKAVFRDLADVHWASVSGTKGKWVLDLLCGDASETYRERIEFDAARVNRIRIFAGSDTSPGAVLMETTWHDVVIGP